MDNLEATQAVTPVQNPSNDQTNQSYLPPFYGLPYLVRFCNCVNPCPTQGDFGNPIPIKFDKEQIYFPFIPTAGKPTIPDGWNDVTSSYQDSFFCQTGGPKDPPDRNRTTGESYKITITAENMQPHFHGFQYYGTPNYGIKYFTAEAYIGYWEKRRYVIVKDKHIPEYITSDAGADYVVEFSASNGLRCAILQNKDSIVLNCHVGMILFLSKEITNNPNLLALTQDFTQYQNFDPNSIIGQLVSVSNLPNFQANGGYILGLDLPTGTTTDEDIANPKWIRQYTGKVKGDNKYKDWFQTTQSLSKVYVKVSDHNHSYKKFNPQSTNGKNGHDYGPVPLFSDMQNRDKITISAGNGEPIDILPSSIQGLVAHLVVDAQPQKK
jgi:hypothetical protein